MKTEAEIKAKKTEVEQQMSAGANNPLQESMWKSLLGFYAALDWVLDEEQEYEGHQRHN